MDVLERLQAQGYDVEREVVDYLETQKQVMQYILYDPIVLGVLYYGGVGGGKTFTICKTAIQVLEHFPGSDCLIARDTRVNLEATTLRTLWGMDNQGQPILPYGIYDEKDHNQTKGFINWPNKSYLSMMGLDTKQNIARVKSTQWSFVGLEEVNEMSWRIVKFIIETRMRHAVGPRKILMTTNTDHGEDEMHQFFFDQHTCDPQKYCNNCVKGMCQFRRVLARTDENKKNLPESFFKRTQHLAAADPRYHDIYMKGEFANVSGVVFPEFSERLHILDLPAGYEWPSEDTGEWVTRYAYDHGWGGSPSCLLETRVHVPTGTAVHCNEYYTNPENPDMKNGVRKISKDLKDLGVRYVHHADPSIKNNNQDDGDDVTSVQVLFRREGIEMELANNDVSGGIELMKNLLTPDEDHKCPVPGASIEGLPDQPYLYIARIGGVITCPNLKRQYKNYKNKQNTRGEENPSKWDPIKIDDHALDPARYTVNAMPLPMKFRKKDPPRGTSAWAKKLQLRNEGLSDPDQLQESGGGFSVVSSL